MDAILGRYSSYCYALLRIVTGFMFMLHGTQKFFGWPPSNRPGGGGSDWLSTLGAGIELVGGLMIMIGLFAGIAAFICSGMMAVAYFGWHQRNGRTAGRTGRSTKSAPPSTIATGTPSATCPTRYARPSVAACPAAPPSKPK